MVASSARTVSTAATCWLSARARSTRKASTWSSTRRTSPFSAHPAVSPRASTNGPACFNRPSKSSRLIQLFAAGQNLDLVPAILGPRILVVALSDRPLLAVGHGLDAARIDAVTDHVLLGRRRAPVTERQVVFVGSALVAMATDANTQPRVRLEDRHLLVQDRGVPTPDDCLVVIEVDHGREEGPHRLRRLSHRGERIRDLLLAAPFGVLTLLGLALGARDGVRAQPLGLSERVRVRSLRRRRCLRRLAAARGHGRDGESAQQEQG